jgi:hypothetical protein
MTSNGMMFTSNFKEINQLLKKGENANGQSKLLTTNLSSQATAV